MKNIKNRTDILASRNSLFTSAAKCSGCTGRDGKHKDLYVTKRDAEFVAIQQENVDLRSYKCPNGPGWHLTKNLPVKHPVQPKSSVQPTRKRQKAPKTIQEYIAGFPTEIQGTLEKITKTIQNAAPQAVGCISEQLPLFQLNGVDLIRFAVLDDRVSIWRVPRGVAEFKGELARYDGSSGSARFLLNQPIPYDLIAKIVRFKSVRKVVRITSGGG